MKNEAHFVLIRMNTVNVIGCLELLTSIFTCSSFWHAVFFKIGLILIKHVIFVLFCLYCSQHLFSNVGTEPRLTGYSLVMLDINVSC